MKQTSHQIALLISILAVTSFLCCGGLFAEEGSSDVSFFFPSDPEFIVIQYHYGYYDGTPLLRVSGDGTVRAYQWRASYSAAPTLEERILIPAGTHTAEMSFDEINKLVRKLLDTGILAFDEDLVQAQLREARRLEFEATGKSHISSEVSVREIRLHFQEISISPEDEPTMEYHSTIRWHEDDLRLDRAAELYPEIEELQRFLKAVTILQDLHKETIQSAAK